MVEEVYRNIFRIGVALPGNPLKELNSYYIRGKDRDLLIDTGFNRKVCHDILQAGLDMLGSDPARRDVLVTHLHSDHCGMADQFASPGRSVYISQTDMELLKTFLTSEDPVYRYERFIKEGFSQEMMAEIFRTNPAMTECLHTIDERFVPVREGDRIRAGEYILEALHVPGHTPGNCMFYIRSEELMFTGDHVLFDITPNITYWPMVKDSLGDYLTQLKRVRDLPVKLALPGHRQTGDYRERIDTLLAHHERRLAEALRIVSENPGLNATEIAGMMKWKIRAADWESFPLIQKWFAVGECLSHLDYHMKRGNIYRIFKNGVYHYITA